MLFLICPLFLKCIQNILINVPSIIGHLDTLFPQHNSLQSATITIPSQIIYLRILARCVYINIWLQWRIPDPGYSVRFHRSHFQDKQNVPALLAPALLLGLRIYRQYLQQRSNTASRKIMSWTWSFTSSEDEVLCQYGMWISHSGLVSLFYGISTFVVYLMPKPFS